MYSINARRFHVHTLFHRTPIFRCRRVININYVHRTIHRRSRNFTPVHGHPGNLRGRNFTFRVSTTNNFIRGMSNELPRRYTHGNSTLFLTTERITYTLFSNRIGFLQLHARRVTSVHHFRHLPRFTFNNVQLNRRRVIARHSYGGITLHHRCNSFPHGKFSKGVISLMPLHQIISYISKLRPRASFVSKGVSKRRFSNNKFTKSKQASSNNRLPTPHDRESTVRYSSQAVVVFQRTYFSDAGRAKLPPSLSDFSDFRVHHRDHVHDRARDHHDIHVRIRVSRQRIVGTRIRAIVKDTRFQRFLRPVHEGQHVGRYRGALNQDRTIRHGVRRQPRLTRQGRRVHKGGRCRRRTNGQRYNAAHVLPSQCTRTNHNAPMYSSIRNNRQTRLGLRGVRNRCTRLFHLLTRFLNNVHVHIGDFRHFGALCVIGGRESRINMFSPVFFRCSNYTRYSRTGGRCGREHTCGRYGDHQRVGQHGCGGWYCQYRGHVGRLQ